MRRRSVAAPGKIGLGIDRDGRLGAHLEYAVPALDVNLGIGMRKSGRNNQERKSVPREAAHLAHRASVTELLFHFEHAF